MIVENINYNVVHTPSKSSQRRVLSDAEFSARQSICGKCEYLMCNGVCRKCGCAGRNKSRIRSVHCPIDKW